MKKALKFLTRDEWTAGNGQCHECCGCKPFSDWHTSTVGHKNGCALAEAIESMGGTVIWERVNLEVEYATQLKWFEDNICNTPEYREAEAEYEKVLEQFRKDVFAPFYDLKETLTK